MKKISLTEKLQKETERLTILVEEAIKNGIPMIQDEAVMAQNRKVDDLVVKVQKELEQNKKGYAGIRQAKEKEICEPYGRGTCPLFGKHKSAT